MYIFLCLPPFSFLVYSPFLYVYLLFIPKHLLFLSLPSSLFPLLHLFLSREIAANWHYVVNHLQSHLSSSSLSVLFILVSLQTSPVVFSLSLSKAMQTYAAVIFFFLSFFSFPSSQSRSF